jgi:hypothetical protein
MRRSSPWTTTVAAFRFEPRGPMDLFAEGLHIRSDGELCIGPPGMAGGDWQLAMFHGDTNADVHADHWELHPASEEAVCCVRGALRVHLRPMDFDAPDIVVAARGGEAVIVPRATWHRLELDEPSDILSLVIREGTRATRRVMTGRVPQRAPVARPHRRREPVDAGPADRGRPSHVAARAGRSDHL